MVVAVPCYGPQSYGLEWHGLANLSVRSRARQRHCISRRIFFFFFQDELTAFLSVGAESDIVIFGHNYIGDIILGQSHIGHSYYRSVT